MCGRFTLRARLNALLQQFDAEVRGEPIELFERYNIAPTNSVAVIRQSSAGRELTKMKWGLIPSWSTEPKMTFSTINARSEEAATKNSFRSAMKHRHCLVLADGYYEWEKVGKQKMPHYFQLRNQPVFGFAGLWERWEKAKPAVESCTILTTRADKIQGEYHDRMPVILSPNDFNAWLDPANTDPASLKYLFEPYPDAEMTDTAVNPFVNKAGNAGPECIEPWKDINMKPTHEELCGALAIIGDERTAMSEVRPNEIEHLATLGLIYYCEDCWRLTPAGEKLLPALVNGDVIEPLI